MRSYGPKARTQSDKLQSALLFIHHARDDKVREINAAKLADREGLTVRALRDRVAWALAERVRRL